MVDWPKRQAIVKSHGGTITLVTAPGAGTAVKVRLPRAEVASDQPETKTVGTRERVS